MKGYNIAIIGKSGVGKSSLINYLFDESELAKTGNGTPVTKPGFHLYEKKIHSRNYSIYDSFGLEPGKVEQWKNDFDFFIGPKQKSLQAHEWLHTTIYCISGASSRYEDFEIEIIKILDKYRLNPIIVLTKSDAKGTKEFAKAIFEETGILPIEICSKEKENFGGIIKPFGKKELIKKIQSVAELSFKERLPIVLKEIERDLIKRRYLNTFNEFKQELLQNKNLIGDISQKKYDAIKGRYQEVITGINDCIKNEIQKELNNALEFYQENMLIVPNCKQEENIFNFREHNNRDIASFISKSLSFSFGLPLVVLYSLSLLFTGTTYQVDDIIKGFKNNLIKNFENDQELMSYFNNQIIIE